MLRGFDYTCGGYTASDYDGTAETATVEALMMIARCTKDAAGLITSFALPPAVAIAIIEAFKSGDPQAFAREFVDKEMPFLRKKDESA
jgi:hypothetical protein